MSACTPIVDAIDAVHGDLSDKMKFMAALRAIKFASPKGDISLDKYGQVIQSMYIREVEKVDGQLANVPIATYTNVDQFWPFTDAEFDIVQIHLQGLKGHADRLQQAAGQEIAARRARRRAGAGRI